MHSMKIEEICEDYGIPTVVADVLKRSGVTRLYPPQADAVRRGVLDGKNLVLAIPTASGKTLIAELCMLKSVLGSGGRCLYIVPLRALASEKYEEFKERYEPLGIKIGISTGDFDIADPRLARYDILVATSEKVDSLLRHRAKWLADVVSVVVLDEVHLINDPGRGPTLEILTARLRQVNPKLQVLALSATIKNADEIAEWLGAELVRNDWRPVPLRRGVFYNGTILFEGNGRRKVEVEGTDTLTALSLDTIRDGGQVLIFVNTRRSAQAVTIQASKHVRDLLKPDELEELKRVARTIEGALGEPTRTCKTLADCVKRGTAFHHAGLHHIQRKAVEDAFRGNLIKMICATPTLAAGINLPARRVIIRDYRRYVEPFGSTPIPVLEIQQMLGRSGRPKYDRFGEALLIAKSEEEVEVLFEEYISGEPERITSKLATEPALRTHVLACIASGYANNIRDVLGFMGYTFFAHQYDLRSVESLVERVLDFLEKEEMVKREKKLITATKFGELVSRLYIDPLSGVVLRDGLMGVSRKKPTDLALLHLVCHTPDMPKFYLGRKEDERFEMLANEHAREFLVPIPEDPDEHEFFLAELKTAYMLRSWLEEVPEDLIHEEFGIGAGDIRRSVETAAWLIHAAHELSRLFKIKHAMTPLRKLGKRIRYGVKEELLDLVRLQGVGRVRARNLFKAGYRKLEDIKRSTERELASVPAIGSEMARSIKRQVEGSLGQAPFPRGV